VTTENTFDVVVDTNVLYAPDPSLIASRGFSASWNDCKSVGTLALIVPEVVKGERMFQLMSWAEAAIQNAHKNFDTIARLLDIFRREFQKRRISVLLLRLAFRLG